MRPGEPSPGADVDGVSRVPVQMWLAGWPLARSDLCHAGTVSTHRTLAYEHGAGSEYYQYSQYPSGRLGRRSHAHTREALPTDEPLRATGEIAAAHSRNRSRRIHPPFAPDARVGGEWQCLHERERSAREQRLPPAHHLHSVFKRPAHSPLSQRQLSHTNAAVHRRCVAALIAT
jgi:hypothetical protein